MELIHWHHQERGTGVTNFYKENLPIYEEAVKQFGDPLLVISKQPLHPAVGFYSLHYLSFEMKDLSKFWEIYYFLYQNPGIVAK